MVTVCIYKVYSLGGGHFPDDRSVGFSKGKIFVNARQCNALL